ncbi:hypothetical protein A0128_05010 [Leptospira tipperaryensis]|uniref:Histidine kinase n=1 Tax=Leptospira tipperaryensis TaxID=2564040 RepID=A0A1D7UUP6_9LEPT|nr:response regulator [Leptospira tipperaryensis]AOP33263.1 hypothetical protein A0128_05010 [Leptospira tipperaryensis]
MDTKESSKILIVEDETLVAQDIKHRLLRMGYSNLIASFTGEDAIEQAQNFQPDLILMDIILSKGRLNGIETVKRIQEFLNVPIIYLTASSDADTMNEAKKTNPNGFILKPFQTRELQIAIELILYKSDSEKEIQKNEQLTRFTLKSLGEGIIAIDNTEAVYFINTIALRLTGRKEEEVIGRSLKEILNFIPIINLDNVEYGKNTSDSLSIPKEGYLILRNGQKRSVSIFTREIVDNEGQVIGKVFVIREKNE